MPKVRRFTTRTLRDVELVFENETGEREKEKFDVVYRSHSQRFLDEVAAAEQIVAEGKTIVPYCAYLAVMVVSITDKSGEPMTDDSGAPALKEVKGDEETQKEAVAHNRAFFETMQVEDGTQSLFNAIQEDISPNPPEASSTPGPSGSEAKASEA
jgi:hypothetical protein